MSSSARSWRRARQSSSCSTDSLCGAGWWARATSRGRARTAGGSRQCVPGIASRRAGGPEDQTPRRGGGAGGAAGGGGGGGGRERGGGGGVGRFTPGRAGWAGLYQLGARGRLEAPGGNRLNSRFERDADQRPEPAGDVAIPFEVPPGR